MVFFVIFVQVTRGRGTSFFPVKHKKLPLSYIQDAKNFSVVKPLNSGEARASPASPVPRPLTIQKSRIDTSQIFTTFLIVKVVYVPTQVCTSIQIPTQYYMIFSFFQFSSCLSLQERSPYGCVGPDCLESTILKITGKIFLVIYTSLFLDNSLLCRKIVDYLSK